MSGLELWLLFIVIPKLSCISSLAFVITIVTLIGMPIFLLAYYNIEVDCFHYSLKERERKEITFSVLKNKLVTVGKKIVIVGSIISVLGVFAPTQKEMAMLVIAPAVINNPEVQKLPTNILKYINDLIAKEKEE